MKRTRASTGRISATISPRSIFTHHIPSFLILQMVSRIIVYQNTNSSKVVLSAYESVHNKGLRKKALDECLKHLRAEDSNTKFADLGPVNKVMNMLIVWIVDGPDSKEFQKHLYRNQDFLWYLVSPDLLSFNGIGWQMMD